MSKFHYVVGITGACVVWQERVGANEYTVSTTTRHTLSHSLTQPQSRGWQKSSKLWITVEWLDTKLWRRIIEETWQNTGSRCGLRNLAWSEIVMNKLIDSIDLLENLHRWTQYQQKVSNLFFWRKSLALTKDAFTLCTVKIVIFWNMVTP